jgi:hypothetical protein
MLFYRGRGCFPVVASVMDVKKSRRPEKQRKEESDGDEKLS